MSIRTWGMAALVATWLGGTAAAFWGFEGRYLRPVPRPPGAISARVSSLPPAAVSLLATNQGQISVGRPGTITVLNFWNPECPCSRFMEPHVARLAAQYEPRGVRFITVIASGSTSAEQRRALACWQARHLLPHDPALADAGNRIAQALGVWAAPAAVILDVQGKVAFVGAYNAARYCDASQTAWAAQALEAVIQGHAPARPTTAFYGCQLLTTKSQGRF